MVNEGLIVKKQNTVMQGGKRVSVSANIPILYTDAIYVHATKFGITLDFAQNLGPTNQQNVVARIGMSKKHAKVFIDLLKKATESKD